MPCGGIYPWGDAKVNPEFVDCNCFQCDKSFDDDSRLMFCEEWDCFLHVGCVKPFLETEEGKLMLSHGHEVVLEWPEIEGPTKMKVVRRHA